MTVTPTLRILEAAESGDTKLLTALIAEDRDLVNASAEYAKTPLHWAAERDRVGVAAILLDNGADLTRETTWGATPLEWAGYLGSNGVAELLIHHGAQGMNLVLAAGLGDLALVKQYGEEHESFAGLGIPKRETDLQDEKGWPPDAARMKGDVLGEAFQVACRNGHTDVAGYLLERGADVHAKGYFGGTGLHWAAAQGHHETVEFLLTRGADTKLEDHAFGRSAFGWAAESGHDSIAALIRDHGEGGMAFEIEH